MSNSEKELGFKSHLLTSKNTFFNSILGTFGANSPAWANYFAGVVDNDLVAMYFFNQPIILSSFGMHYMVEEKTNIYPPISIEVWGGNDSKNLRLLTKLKPKLPLEGEEHTLPIIEGLFKSQKVSCIKIIAKPYLKIKAKSKGKGYDKTKTLLLVDEMFLN